MSQPSPARRRIPIGATIAVLAAVAIMVALGFWQLRRLHEKETLLAHYAAAQSSPIEIEWPASVAQAEADLYRRARLDCRAASDRSAMAGHNAQGESGWAQTAQCRLSDGASAKVVLGWSMTPQAGQDWRGGMVHGVIAPGPRLVADPPLAGLAANAKPDASEIPNNHLSYAVQWFLFALTALVIYAIALAKRLRG